MESPPAVAHPAVTAGRGTASSPIADPTHDTGKGAGRLPAACSKAIAASAKALSGDNTDAEAVQVTGLHALQPPDRTKSPTVSGKRSLSAAFDGERLSTGPASVGRLPCLPTESDLVCHLTASITSCIAVCA